MGMRCEMLLYMASRAQMMVEKILPALNAGSIVISDRFVSSTLAYQLGGDGLSADEKAFGTEPELSDQDKRALIAFLKTF